MTKQLQYFEQIQKIMMQSGQLVMQRFGTDITILQKKGGSIVTAVDFENEQFLKEQLSTIVPQAAFFAEESGCSDVTAEYVWVIDSLDGTRNFIKGLPFFCSMIALTYKNEVMVAAMYQPLTRQFYYAEKNKGLWLNGDPLSFIDRLNKHKTALIVSDSASFKVLKSKFLECPIQISRRYFGCIGFDIAYLIAGNIDLIIAESIHWWDLAPGLLMLAESGVTFEYEKSVIQDGLYRFKAGNKLFF